jgi:hypothetical protein
MLSSYLLASTPNVIRSVTLGSGLNTGQLAPFAFCIVISNFMDKTLNFDSEGLISSKSGIVATYRFCGSNVNEISSCLGSNWTFTDDLSMFFAKMERTQVC